MTLLYTVFSEYSFLVSYKQSRIQAKLDELQPQASLAKSGAAGHMKSDELEIISEK